MVLEREKIGVLVGEVDQVEIHSGPGKLYQLYGTYDTVND